MILKHMISDREKQILFYLMMRGPSCGNQISRTLGLGSSTVSTRARNLEKKGLVALRDPSHQEILLDHAHHRYLLDLTLRGLIVALADIRSHNPEITSIRSHWGHLLPQVFGKWDHFRKENVEGHAKKRLLAVAVQMVTPSFLADTWAYLKSSGNWKGVITSDWITTDWKDRLTGELERRVDESVFTMKFLFGGSQELFNDEFSTSPENDDMVDPEWEQACAKDAELYGYIKEGLTESIKKTRKRLDSLRSKLSVIKRLRG